MVERPGIAAAHGLTPGARRNAVRHAEQPACDRPVPANRPRPMRQHKESGLEGVLRIVRVPQHAPANTEDHWTVTDHKLLECRFRRLVPPRDKPFQELSIGHRSDRAQVE